MNNIVLYNRIGFRGDIDSVYYTTINFLHKGNVNEPFFEGKIKFSLDKNIYKEYIEDYGKDKRLVLFDFKNKDELKQSLISNITAINAIRNNKGSNNVEISESIIMIEGTVVKLNFYSLDSVLFLQVKIVNHGVHELNLKPSLFLVRAGDSLVKPQIISVVNSIPSDSSDSYNIMRSGRLEMMLKYEGIDAKEILLMSKGLTFYDGGKALFSKPVVFAKDTVPLQN